MENNTDLVDAIDEAIECIEDNTYHNGAEFRTYEMDEQQRELVRVSLIRARDALRWILPTERLPIEREKYRVTVRPMGVNKKPWITYDEFIPAMPNGRTAHWRSFLGEDILAWQENPAPYTPEEK